MKNLFLITVYLISMLNRYARETPKIKITAGSKSLGLHPLNPTKPAHEATNARDKKPRRDTPCSIVYSVYLSMKFLFYGFLIVIYADSKLINDQVQAQHSLRIFLTFQLA